MRRERQLDLIEKLLHRYQATAAAGQLAVDNPSDATIPVENYFSEARRQAEQEVLFRRYPLIVGHRSELPAPGDLITHDSSGVPILVVHGRDGVLRAFLNVCRHRGSKLVTEERGQRKGLVCRYHAWAYDLSGALIHIPQSHCFPSVDCAQLGLVELPLYERYGLLWVIPQPGATFDIAAHLRPLDEDLEGFGLASHHVHKRERRRRNANWKLLIDAFQEGYHVKSLHRDTLYRFFLDIGSLFEELRPHSRSVGARRALAQAATLPQSEWDFRAMTTAFYLLFPNSVLVLHPDWISLISVFPDGTDHFVYHHTMLIPQAATNEQERAHWDKTFHLIEGQVFQTEDLEICESIQAGLRAGANDRYHLGYLETAVKWFHDNVERALAAR